MEFSLSLFLSLFLSFFLTLFLWLLVDFIGYKDVVSLFSFCLIALPCSIRDSGSNWNRSFEISPIHNLSRRCSVGLESLEEGWVGVGWGGLEGGREEIGCAMNQPPANWSEEVVHQRFIVTLRFRHRTRRRSSSGTTTVRCWRTGSIPSTETVAQLLARIWLWQHRGPCPCWPSITSSTSIRGTTRAGRPTLNRIPLSCLLPSVRWRFQSDFWFSVSLMLAGVESINQWLECGNPARLNLIDGDESANPRSSQ